MAWSPWFSRKMNPPEDVVTEVIYQTGLVVSEDVVTEAIYQTGLVVSG